MAEFEYGLTIRKKEEKKIRHVNIFEGIEDNEADDNAIDPRKRINALLRQQQDHNKIKVADEISKVLEENSKIYEYDSIYDTITSKNQKSSVKNDEKNQAKYIEAMMKRKGQREIEQSIIREKVESQKRLREGEPEKPKFITKSYENQLNIHKKAELKNLFEEKYDKKFSVNEETGVAGFYANLFTKNKDFTSGTRGEGEIKLVEEHNKRKERYTQMIEEQFDQELERKRQEEENKRKKKEDERKQKLAEEKRKIEQLISPPEIKEVNIMPETPQDIKKQLTNEEKKELYKQKYLERKRKAEEQLETV